MESALMRVHGGRVALLPEKLRLKTAAISLLPSNSRIRSLNVSAQIRLDWLPMKS